MSIRSAQVGDLEAVHVIATSSPFAAAWSRDQYRKEIGSKQSCFVVWDEDEVRGYLLALHIASEAQLVDIAVRDAGRGIGKALLEHLEGVARGWGCEKITLEVSAGNERALRLYRRAGYDIVGRRPKFYNDGSDAILMDRLLA